VIEPAKHLDLDLCILRAAAILLRTLRSKRVVAFVELQSALQALGPDGEILFIPTLNLLFLLGRLEYRPQTDSFEYVEHVKRIEGGATT
jgi:hypothetical protein